MTNSHIYNPLWLSFVAFPWLSVQQKRLTCTKPVPDGQTALWRRVLQFQSTLNFVHKTGPSSCCNYVLLLTFLNVGVHITWWGKSKSFSVDEAMWHFTLTPDTCFCVLCYRSNFNCHQLFVFLCSLQWLVNLFIYLFIFGGGVLTFKPLLQYIKTFFRWFKPVYLDRGLFIWSIPIHSDLRLHVNCQKPEVALSGPEDTPAFLKLPMSQFNWALTICGKHGSFHGRHTQG